MSYITVPIMACAGDDTKVHIFIWQDEQVGGRIILDMLYFFNYGLSSHQHYSESPLIF